MSENSKLANPAVVGLAGFGMTTFLLQLHNLGICGLGTIICLGIFFGGAAQFIAGLLEFKTGNNFGFCAFTAYGAFWMATVVLWFLNACGPEAFKSSAIDLGYYLAFWGIFTSLMFLEAIRHHTVGALIFLTLALGFFGLATADFMGAAEGLGKTIKTIAAIDLIVCAALAWYNMVQIIFADSGVKLPLGKPWMTCAK